MKRILHIIPYKNLYPPKNGGQLRCFHLMNELSKYFAIDVVLFQDKNDIKEKGYINDNIIFYSPERLRKENVIQKLIPTKLYNAIKYRLITKSLKGPADITVLDFYPIIKKLKNNKYDFVIFEHIAAMKLSIFVKKFFPEAKLILDAHNVDHILYEQEKSTFPNKISDKLIKNTKQIETNLSKYVDYVFACSQVDLDVFNRINLNKVKGIVVPNGVNISGTKFNILKDTSKTLIFCGALNTSANKNGLLWFYENIWEHIVNDIPYIKLIIVGSGENDFSFAKMKKDKRIDFKGYVDDLGEAYKESYIAIVPLHIGSGTRLKILEAMAFGVPVISTPIGAEGVSYPLNSIIIEDNSRSFKTAIYNLFENIEMHEQQRNIAYSFVSDNYDWSIIVEKSLEKFNTLK